MEVKTYFLLDCIDVYSVQAMDVTRMNVEILP
jgi:hypothetical protein